MNSVILETLFIKKKMRQYTIFCPGVRDAREQAGLDVSDFETVFENAIRQYDTEIRLG